MCGIFGIITKNNTNYTKAFLQNSLKTLALLSESRGKDSSGLCLLDSKNNRLNVLKGPIPVSELFKKQQVKEKISQAFSKTGSGNYMAFGHARLVTNGTQLDDDNNQPVVKDGVIGVHNGIVVNTDELWNKNKEIKKDYDIDTEVFLALTRYNLTKNYSLRTAIKKAINDVEGTVSAFLTFVDRKRSAFVTNNGSLYILHNSTNILFFASEKYMLEEFKEKLNLKSVIGEFKLFQLQPKSGLIIDPETFNLEAFTLNEADKNEAASLLEKNRSITLSSFKSAENQLSTLIDINKINENPKSSYEKSLLLYPVEKIKQLKRCSKCILPYTFPFIEFDARGVCNYCNNYKLHHQPKTINDLHKLVEPFRNNNGVPNILVPFSGGRDSTFVVDYVKEELKLNPITFTYDWGMVTDLARRNIARVCGKLGVENIIVAADIHKKRRNIKLNINAWLNDPKLGMIPLFMAGDKYFLYYANVVKSQNNLGLTFWGSNTLENTDFKTGFCGLAPSFSKERIDSISLNDKIKLTGFFLKNYIKNPKYFNASLIDTAGAFASRYVVKRDGFVQLFDYVKWNEAEIEKLLYEKYGWEKATDTSTTWRIGDGTASFYNYIYHSVAGFSEYDTFRSNQVREGMLSREMALEKVMHENIPRYETLKWYLEILGLDFETVIKQVNKMPKIF